jgi:hypothetical protein
VTEYFGNLALQRRRAPVARPANQIEVPQTREFKMRRIPVSITAAPEAAHRAKARSIQRSLTRQRLKLLLSVTLIFMVVTGIFALVVYRQAMILELNFANGSIERQISRIEQNNSQISESLAQKTNLDLIRQQAVSRLGLQDPAHTQIITVKLPDSDRVVYASAASSGVNDQVYLAGVLSSIEGYFRTIDQQRQND